MMEAKQRSKTEDQRTKVARWKTTSPLATFDSCGSLQKTHIQERLYVGKEVEWDTSGTRNLSILKRFVGCVSFFVPLVLSFLPWRRQVGKYLRSPMSVRKKRESCGEGYYTAKGFFANWGAWCRLPCTMYDVWCMCMHAIGSQLKEILKDQPIPIGAVSRMSHCPIPLRVCVQPWREKCSQQAGKPRFSFFLYAVLYFRFRANICNRIELLCE